MEIGTGIDAGQVRTTLGLLPIIALSGALAAPAFAQETGTGSVPLQEVVVEGGQSQNANRNATGLARLPGTVQDTPQVVNVVTGQTMAEQQTQTLEQVLRNVPGVTMASGEGNGGLNGDQFRIRGFEAKNDIYSDGLRDFGVYVRDSFAYEGVQVFKGPSSETFGMGTVGGAINTQTKKAHLTDETIVETQFGTSPLARVMVDWNRKLNETTAMRLVGVGHWEDVAGRDNIGSDRAGFLAALSTGIGTDLTWDLNYYFQHGDRTPDSGVPMVVRGTATKANPALPITEFGVDRAAYYGKAQDHDIFNTHAVTSNVRWEMDERWTFQNDTRVSYYDRDFSTSIPACTDTCANRFLAGNAAFLTSYGGGNPTYEQESWGIQNVSTAVGKFDLGGLRHELVVGLDVFYQDNKREYYTVTGKNAALVNVRDPAATYDLPYSVARNTASDRSARGTNVGVFASDRVWLTDMVSVLAGGRLDYYGASYDRPRGTGAPPNPATIEEHTTFFSPKTSLIFEPTPDQTYYASWARSFTPPGQFVTNAAEAINATQTDLEPEISDLFEVGGKVTLLDGRLGLTAAVFQVEKSNATYTDATTGDAVATGETQRVQGVEIGATGLVTDAWTVGASYSHLRSEVLTSTTAANVGNAVGYVPKHAASLWTSYEISRHLDMPGKLSVGGGVFYSGEYYTASANTAEIPASLSLDAFASFEYRNLTLALNGYNLTDELNYTAGFSNRAVVGPGRSFVLTVSAKY